MSPTYINPDADWSGVTNSPVDPLTLRWHLQAIRDEARHDDPSAHVAAALAILDAADKGYNVRRQGCRLVPDESVSTEKSETAWPPFDPHASQPKCAVELRYGQEPWLRIAWFIHTEDAQTCLGSLQRRWGGYDFRTQRCA